MARETITLKESGITLVPPTDVVMGFFASLVTGFLKETVTVLTTPFVSEGK